MKRGLLLWRALDGPFGGRYLGFAVMDVNFQAGSMGTAGRQGEAPAEPELVLA